MSCWAEAIYISPPVRNSVERGGLARDWQTPTVSDWITKPWSACARVSPSVPPCELCGLINELRDNISVLLNSRVVPQTIRLLTRRWRFLAFWDPGNLAFIGITWLTGFINGLLVIFVLVLSTSALRYDVLRIYHIFVCIFHLWRFELNERKTL